MQWPLPTTLRAARTSAIDVRWTRWRARSRSWPLSAAIAAEPATFCLSTAVYAQIGVLIDLTRAAVNSGDVIARLLEPVLFQQHRALLQVCLDPLRPQWRTAASCRALDELALHTVDGGVAAEPPSWHE
eukprot:scaffold295468_cov27-Tisochrysis_lutea.AAC.1